MWNLHFHKNPVGEQPPWKLTLILKSSQKLVFQQFIRFEGGSSGCQSPPLLITAEDVFYFDQKTAK